MSEQLHTVAQAAKRLRLHPKTVLRLIHEGRLKGTRIGKSYRILESDLDAFAGVAAGKRPAPVKARATCVVEVQPLAVESSGRIASLLNAAVMADHARPDPVHLSTAYDPEARSLKVVMIATPADAGALLRLLELQLESLR